MEHAVGAVEPWSAEAPRLYGAEVRAPGEWVRTRTGSRTVEVSGGQLRVDGRPLLRGVNRYEWHPDHTHEPVPGGRIRLHLDQAHHGIGTASCGPGALPAHRLTVGQHRFRLGFSPVG